MRVDDAQGIVEMVHEACLTDDVHADPRDAAAADPHDDGAPASNDASGGCDDDEARNHALHDADDGRFLEEDDVQQHPDEEAHCGREVGVQHGRARVGRGRVRISTVEAVPAQPEQTAAAEGHDDVVGSEVVAVGFETWPDPVGADESGCARGQMDDVAAGVVNHAHLVEKATAPDTVCADGVGEGEPEGHKEHPGEEVHAPEVGAGDEDERDGGEDELEIHHGAHGEGLSWKPRRWEDALLEFIVHSDGGSGNPDEG